MTKLPPAKIGLIKFVYNPIWTIIQPDQDVKVIWKPPNPKNYILQTNEH